MEGNHGDLGEHAATSSARGNAGYAMNYHIQDLVSQDRIKAVSQAGRWGKGCGLLAQLPKRKHVGCSKGLVVGRKLGSGHRRFVRAPPPVYHVRPMVQVAKPVPRAVIMNQAGILGPYPGHQHSNQSSRSCSPMLPMYSPGHGLDQPYTSTYSGATAANHGNNKITDSENRLARDQLMMSRRVASMSAHYGSVLSVKILKRNRRKDHRNGGGDGLKENIDPLDVSDEAFEKLDFGFVEVAEESIAKRIIRDLGGLGYRVRHATELPIDPKAVHLKNLPMSMDSKGLADFIRSQGLEGIDTVKVLRQPANRLSASAFIRASSELSAYKLIRGMHGKACPGSQYTIEARFAYHNNKKATVNEYQKYGPATLSKYVLTTTDMGALSPLIGNNFTWVTMPCGYDTAYSQAQLKCVVWVPNSVVPGSEHPFLPILIFSDRLPLLGVPSPRHGAFAGLPFESSPGDVFHAPVLEFNVSKMTIPLVAYPTFEKLVAEVPEPDSDDDDTECSLTMPITAPSAAAPAPAQPGPL
ncbi:unnamed protein product [Notodromas monacha]|uniref:RRM domain-containing protein n=1 Tax=Notodromas monacha TaxID=399045 RepID=A0A7R9BUG9_9CRUS|nr:unnamed protein product [Notodromas monacha]CAG0921612.1 unnamed protein product [Notodromas monacha]